MSFRMYDTTVKIKMGMNLHFLSVLHNFVSFYPFQLGPE